MGLRTRIAQRRHRTCIMFAHLPRQIVRPRSNLCHCETRQSKSRIAALILRMTFLKKIPALAQTQITTRAYYRPSTHIQTPPDAEKCHSKRKYTENMRRLLQFGTLMLLLSTFLSPMLEFFDRWDPPGPGNDTEMAVFGTILVLCLVLLVCKLTASLACLVSFISVLRHSLSRGLPVRPSSVVTSSFIPPLSPPPLRI
jgi:hypothetical protein